MKNIWRPLKHKLLSHQKTFFEDFFNVLTPKNKFDQENLGVFCCPTVVQELSSKKKVRCHRIFEVISKLNKKWRLYGRNMEVV